MEDNKYQKAFERAKNELMKEQKPEVELEEEIQECWQKWLSPSNQNSVDGVFLKKEFAFYARHFYELGRKQVLQEIYNGKVKPVDKITAAWLDDKEEDK